MSDHIQPDPPGALSTDRFDPSSPIDIRLPSGLPPWLARHLLRKGEEVAWLRGPRWNPEWERRVTHPILVFYAAAFGAVLVAAGVVRIESWPWLLIPTALVAGGMVIGSLFLVGIAAGYFTRLVVTNYRVFIVQGYEVCRTWNIDDLPLSLIRYTRPGRERASRTVDLEALQTMLGGPSDQFVDSKMIMAFGKQLDGIRARKNSGA